MKICMIATRHRLDDARVVYKEALSLLNAGHEVCLILNCNDRFEYLRYDGSVIASGKPPNGEINFQGLKIFGRPKRKGLFGKWKTYRELTALAVDLKADIYHAHEPDLSLAVALRTKSILSKKAVRPLVIHDMHEFPPGFLADNVSLIFKVPAYLAQLFWNKLASNRIDHVFASNSILRGYAILLDNRTSVDVIFNAPILKLFPQPIRKSWPEQGEKIVLCYEGSLPFEGGLKEMVDVIHHLRDRVNLCIIGDVFGEERVWLKNAIEANGLQDSITITGWLPYEKVGEALNGCHLGLILLKDSMNNRFAAPNKLFNYMNAGIPVLSVDYPELRRIISEEKCGFLIHDQSPGSITAAIEALISNPGELKIRGENGQRAVRNYYSWEATESRFLAGYERLAEKNGLSIAHHRTSTEQECVSVSCKH